MAGERNVWTVPLEGGRWGNHFEAACGSWTAGRERARRHRVEHIIQKADGTIGERNSYGGDSPRRPG